MAIRGLTTTVHADRRAKKRIGVKDPSQLFEEAQRLGMKVTEARGQFKKYLDKSSIIHKSTPIIYKGFIYWHRAGVLVTIIPLHQKWFKYLKGDNR